jgi:hypothetical protein
MNRITVYGIIMYMIEPVITMITPGKTMDTGCTETMFGPNARYRARLYEMHLVSRERQFNRPRYIPYFDPDLVAISTMQ